MQKSSGTGLDFTVTPLDLPAIFGGAQSAHRQGFPNQVKKPAVRISLNNAHLT
jgi:hypothetical protein